MRHGRYRTVDHYRTSRCTILHLSTTIMYDVAVIVLKMYIIVHYSHRASGNAQEYIVSADTKYRTSGNIPNVFFPYGP